MYVCVGHNHAHAVWLDRGVENWEEEDDLGFRPLVFGGTLFFLVCFRIYL